MLISKGVFCTDLCPNTLYRKCIKFAPKKGGSSDPLDPPLSYAPVTPVNMKYDNAIHYNISYTNSNMIGVYFNRLFIIVTIRAFPVLISVFITSLSVSAF